MSLHGWATKLRQVGRMHVGRILGSVPATNGAYKSLIDLIERTYFMRAEINALTSLLLKKGLFTEAELTRAFEEEYKYLFDEVSKNWPEITFTETGATVKDPVALATRSKAEGWPP